MSNSRVVSFAILGFSTSPEPCPVTVIVGFLVYPLPLVVTVTFTILSPFVTAVAVACTPLVESGALIVIVGLSRNPVPAFTITMLSR